VRIKQRSILWYLVFIGFSVNYMIRINVNISIVDMIDKSYKKTTNSTINEPECFVRTEQNFTEFTETNSYVNVAESSPKFPTLERILLDTLGVKKNLLSLISDKVTANFSSR
jgi:hypothetical protein